MNRLVLFLVAFPALLLTGFGAVYYLWPEDASDGQQGASQRQFAQITLPWATEEKGAPAPKAPATPTPTPVPAPKAQSAPAPSVQMEEGKEPQAAGPGWAVNCSSEAGQKGLSCQMSQTVVAKQSGRTLTNVAFLLSPESKNPEVLLRLPLGLYLPAGATYQVDENAPQRLSIRACDRNGCYARGPVSPESMGSLTKGKQLKIDFKNLAEESVSIPLSLDGFASAYEKIQRL
jgi:invasion protein IalB